MKHMNIGRGTPGIGYMSEALEVRTKVQKRIIFIHFILFGSKRCWTQRFVWLVCDIQNVGLNMVCKILWGPLPEPFLTFRLSDWFWLTLDQKFYECWTKFDKRL
jgi:hypothetical protein